MMKYLFLSILMLSVTACSYEDSDITLHQAGIYKGKIDTHSQTAEQRAAILAKRFEQVQTDRLGS